MKLHHGRGQRFAALAAALAMVAGCGRNVAPEAEPSAPSTRSLVGSSRFGLWGIGPEETDSEFAQLWTAGIRELSVAGYVTSPYHDDPIQAAAATNQIIANANASGRAFRVTAYIITPQLARADSIGSTDEIHQYIDACNTTFFNMDEPFLNHISPTSDYVGHVPGWVVQDVIHYVNAIDDPVVGQGVYSSTAEPFFHEDYFTDAYRVMPDYYGQSLEWKRNQYYNVGGMGPIAPLIALVQRAGGDFLSGALPDYIDLKAEYNNAVPYCQTIWFYAGHAGTQNGPDYDVFDDGGIGLLTDLLAASNPGLHPWDLQNWEPPFGTTAPEVPVGSGRPAAADYDGDGRADLSIKWYDGHWYVNFSGTGLGTGWEFPFSGTAGGEAVVPTVGDYDGDGKADRSAYDSDEFGTGRWLISYSSWGPDPVWDHTAFTLEDLGWPFPGDYDGDGRTDIALVGSDGKWRIDYSLNGFESLYVTSGWDYMDDVPSVNPNLPGNPIYPSAGDFDGDGYTDRVQLSVGANWGSTVWKVQYSRVNWVRTYTYPYLSSGTPVPADYDGDGIDDIALISGNTWYIDKSGDGFNGWDDTWDFGGLNGGFPCTADFDGDGRADRSVMDPSGAWGINMWENSFGTKLSAGLVRYP